MQDFHHQKGAHLEDNTYIYIYCEATRDTAGTPFVLGKGRPLVPQEGIVFRYW